MINKKIRRHFFLNPSYNGDDVSFNLTGMVQTHNDTNPLFNFSVVDGSSQIFSVTRDCIMHNNQELVTEERVREIVREMFLELNQPPF